MMTRSWLALVLLATGGCTSLTATLVPVQGPLSKARPLRTIEAKATGTGGYNGGLSWQMPDGEACKGRWSVVNQTGSFAFTSANLLSTYGDTHLSGFSLGSTAGWNRGYAVVTCSQSRTFEIEFVSRGHGFGIAKDTDDNIYRFVF